MKFLCPNHHKVDSNVNFSRPEWVSVAGFEPNLVKY